MKKIILIVFILSAVTGCKKDFLDKKPQAAISTSIIWGSDAYAIMAVNGIYAEAFLDGNPYMNYNWLYGVWGPDAMDYGGGGTEQGTRDAGAGDFWRKYAYLYGDIRLANDAIAHLTDNDAITPELRARLIGEATFLRGFFYFDLWALYGGVPIIDKVMPIAETYTLTRNTSEEVRDFMIKDFTAAIAALPVDYPSSSDLGRATRGAAQAMLGKTYLYAQDYPKAVEELGKLMQPPYHYALYPDYAKVFDQFNEHNSEIIFDMEMINQAGLGSENDFRYGGRSLPVSGWSQTVASWAMVNSYTNKDGSAIDISDMPKRESFASEYDYGLALIPWYQQKYKNVDTRLKDNIILPGDSIVGNGYKYYMVKWPYAEHANDNPYPAYQLDISTYACFPWRKYVINGSYSHEREDAPINMILIRYADILLLWAEAKNEVSGPSSDIYDEINKIRDRGGVVPVSGLSKDELRQEIRLERMRELAGEGELFFDVRRWRTAATTDPIFGLNRVEYDFTMRPLFTSVFPEFWYLWPIPQDDIDLNKNLVQNPGW